MLSPVVLADYSRVVMAKDLVDLLAGCSRGSIPKMCDLRDFPAGLDIERGKTDLITSDTIFELNFVFTKAEEMSLYKSSNFTRFA